MKRLRWVASILILAAVVALFLYAYRSDLYGELNRLKLIPQPEPFTELYLNDYSSLSSSLPTKIVYGQKISFSFIIHNVEGRVMSYPYKVYIVNDDTSTTTIDSKTVTLAANASTSIPESYMFSASHKQATIFIDLKNPPQSLHFFVPSKSNY